MTTTDIVFYTAGIILRALALLLLLVRILPIQYREYKIGNGLKKYRRMLFALGIALFVSTLIPFLIALGGIYADADIVGRAEVSFSNSLNDFIIVVMVYFIYNFKGGE